ncbi:MAG: hypothetical protein ACRC1G_18040 [Bradyrhizobium sp.]|nr:hypothetical protein [Bradyrhizobium sp.]
MADQSLEYYKLKEDLGRFLKDEITRAVQNERDLQQKYIGIGLKVAGVGIAVAVLVVGLFGIKSIYDVDSAIKKIPDTINRRVDDEVMKRFNADNPVAKYELTLLENAARAVSASLTTQSTGWGVDLDGRSSNVIIQALDDKNIRTTLKLTLVEALSNPKVGDIPSTVDQAIVAFATRIATTEPGNTNGILQCMNYFSARTPGRFAADVEKLFDKTGANIKIRLAVARFALKLPRNTGDNLIKKLTAADDIDIRYLMYVRSLATGKNKQVNQELISSTMERLLPASIDDEHLGFAEMIDHLNLVYESSDVAPKLADAIRNHAISKGLYLTTKDRATADMRFHFVTAEGNAASATFRAARLTQLMRFAVDQIKDELKKSNGEFTDSTIRLMELWFPIEDSKAGIHSRRAGGLRLYESGRYRFVSPDGKETPGTALPDQVTLTTSVNSSGPGVTMAWSDESGLPKSMRVTKIVNLDVDSLEEYGIWTRASPEE